jgi:ABC-type phosphate transport system substrate-binding protein
LILKRIITQQDWNKWHSDITISFSKDNHFAELKDAEILNERINTLQQVEPYIGKYISHEYVMKNVLKMDEDEITDMRKQIDIEATGKFFTEIRDSQELSDRVTALSDLENYIGKYVSVEFAMKNILKMSEKEIEDMKNQIEAEKEEMGSNDDDF